MKKQLLLITAIVLVMLSVPAALAAEKIAIDKTHFPDETFREKVKQFDLNSDGYLSKAERDKVTAISVPYAVTLKGVEHFPALEELRCEGADLTELDVSKNTKLRTLKCRYNALTALDLKNNTALTALECDNNALTALDVSACTGLESLICGSNKLTTLNVKNNKKLSVLQCDHNLLSALNVSSCGELTELSCYGNGLKSLKLPAGKKLRSLLCFSNKLTSLNVSACAGLRDLMCGQNGLTALDVSKNTALTSLACEDNPLKALDVSKNTALTQLCCRNDGLTALNVRGNTRLRDLDCSGNKLTALDLTKNAKLTNLICADNALLSLDVSACTALYQLDCRSNRLAGLDLTKNGSLGKDCCKFGGNVRSVTAEAGRIFFADLGIDGGRVSDVAGATKSSAFLTVSKSGKVTYKYLARTGLKIKFTLNVTYKKGVIGSVTIPKDSWPYTGKAVRPEVTVKAKIAGRTVKLSKGTHYKVYYRDNVIPGTATITVKGIGHYKGTLTRTFRVTKVKLSSLTLDKTTWTYTGSEIKPGVTVTAKVNGQTVTLEKGVDYSVKYTNNIKKGTAAVTVTGIGNFTGTLTKKFTIQ